MNKFDRTNILQQIAKIKQEIAHLGKQQKQAETTLRSLNESLSQADNAITNPDRSQEVAVTRGQSLSRMEKVSLFLRLFRGREDVYPKLWHNQRTGKKGYTPACANEWVRGVCEKPRVKCGKCPNQAFLPVSAGAVLDHLQGRQVMGVYPMLKDETCWFLAIDFDKEA